MLTIEQLNTAARDAFKNGYINDAILHSSDLIEKIQKQLVNALEFRARVWKKAVKLEQELSDTLMIIEYDSNKTAAYLHAANLYSIQGNQHKAKLILQKSLDSSPTKDEYDMIQEQIVKANERLERRIDFITETPFDILCNIVKYLGFEAVLNCMEVCVTWRHMISQCPEPWRDVGMRTVQFWKGYNKAEIFPRVSHHIKRLSLNYPDDLSEDIEIFRTSNLCRMETLGLTLFSSLKVDHSLTKTICDTIYRMEHRLTDLRISGPITIPSIGQILTGCPCLTKLQLYVHTIHDWTTGLPKSTLLTSAYINLRELPTDANDLKPFFRCSPNLVRVKVCPGYQFLHYGQPLDILPALENHCPQLISIENFSGHNRPDYYTWNETFDGLKCAALANIQSALPLYSRLERATDSLRSLHITTLNGGLDSILADWRPLSSFTLNNLEYLGIDADPRSALYQHLPKILRSCPALETLRLKSSTTRLPVPQETTNQIFTTAIGLEKLSSLHLRCFVVHGQGFRQFMQHHARQNTMRVIDLNSCVVVDCTLLHDIARINALEYLNIHDVNVDRYPEVDVMEFARLVSQLPDLRSLGLFDMNLSVEAATYLSKSQAPLSLTLTNYGEELLEDAYEILKDIIDDDRDDYDNYDDDDEDEEDDDDEAV